jgi:hypothetical protein
MTGRGMHNYVIDALELGDRVAHALEMENVLGFSPLDRAIHERDLSALFPAAGEVNG